jgi:hypothetical protein
VCDMGKQVNCSFKGVVRSVNLGRYGKSHVESFLCSTPLKISSREGSRLDLMLTEKTHKYRNYKPPNHAEPSHSLVTAHGRTVDEAYCLSSLGGVMSVLTHRRSRTNSATLELALHESGCV